MAEEFHNVREQIEDILRKAFQPQFLEIIDDSARHVGHAGHNGNGESHFKVKIISNSFRNKSRIESHQMIYQSLADLVKNQIHALQIDAKAIQ